MSFKHVIRVLLLTVCTVLFSAQTQADKPLKSALDLSIDQAAQVVAVQKEARDAIRKPRGELHRLQRALRRAESANDAALMAELEQQIQPLKEQLKQIHADEERKIRALLTPEQTIEYKQWLKERDAMVGSSRDVKEYRR